MPERERERERARETATESYTRKRTENQRVYKQKETQKNEKSVRLGKKSPTKQANNLSQAISLSLGYCWYQRACLLAG
jgi:hypothetical protein